MRIGPNTQKLTTAEQMRDFFQQSDRIYFDEVACTSFMPSSMVDDNFLLIFKGEAHLSIAVPNTQVFSNLKLYTSDNHFKNGAVLFFGKNPEQFLDKAQVRCIAFDGVDKRFITDDKIFGGNLYNQYLLAMQWLRGKLNIRYDIEGQGAGPRKEIWEIPETVFKEVIINALSHRDYYDRGAIIHIEVYTDRVEITNPGGLVSAIPAAEFGSRSHSRNPLIFGLFARMHLVEQIGSGISRIKQLMIEAALPAPIFHKDGLFVVTLYRPLKANAQPNIKNQGKRSESTRVKPIQNIRGKTREKTREKNAQKTREKIVVAIEENNQVTTTMLAEIIGLTDKGIEYHLQKLKKSQIIERLGPDKGGYWKVNKKP